jgi:hypothetical protein
MDRSINQRIAPKGEREPGMLLDRGKQTLMGYDRHFTRTNGGNRVIHGTHQQCAQITAVTGNQEGRDLTTTATEQIIATGDPGADQVDLGGLASVGHDIVSRSNVENTLGQLSNSLPLGIR